ncbi:hypothetical protein ACVILK_005361 [Bradyrhizobium embrapense]
MREKKTADELRAMFMEEVAKHPSWSHIRSVAITRSFATAPKFISWYAGFVCEGREMAPAAAFVFAKDLARQYDLDGEP